MSAPRDITARNLNALKGWPSPHALDYVAELNDDITDVVFGGSCVSVDPATGKYMLGVGALHQMPMFLFQNSDDPDVTNESFGDPATTFGVFVPIAPTGKAMALVATGAYELVSTEFVDADYDPNDHLTSPTSGVNKGKLMAGTPYTDTIVGVVSRGVVDNGYGHDALAFWPYYLPS